MEVTIFILKNPTKILYLCTLLIATNPLATSWAGMKHRVYKSRNKFLAQRTDSGPLWPVQNQPSFMAQVLRGPSYVTESNWKMAHSEIKKKSEEKERQLALLLAVLINILHGAVIAPPCRDNHHTSG